MENIALKLKIVNVFHEITDKLSKNSHFVGQFR